MDRPTIRRGRHGSNAESVSVADLLARSTPAEKAVLSAIQERAAAEATARAADEARDRTAATTGQLPLVVDPAAVEEPRVSNRLARTIMAATTAMLLCGVVTTFSVFTTEGGPRLSPSTPTVEPVKITGATVVRPDLLNGQLAAGLLTAGNRAAGTEANGSAGALLPDDDLHAERLTGLSPAGPGTGTVTGPQVDDVRKLIENFYAAAEESPERAFALLGPDMRGDGQASFVRSWNDLLVEVHQLVVGDGGVARAVIVIAWPDATVIRAEQLLVVSDGPEPKIVRAELLSAHRG